MSCLVLTHYPPHSAVGGSALRNLQNIRGLRPFGPVDVLSVGVDGEVSPVEGVREHAAFGFGRRTRRDRLRAACWLLRPGACRSIERFHLGEVTAWMTHKMSTDPYDFVVLEGITLASYVATLRRLGCTVVFDAHNVESALHRQMVAACASGRRSAVRRLKDRIVERRLAEAEKRAVLGADVVWACSDHDADAIKRLYGARSVTVVPNGVDVDSYRTTIVADSDWSAHPIALLYQGLFAYGPNLDAAKRLVEGVLPAVRGRGYDARVTLVGRDPAPEMLSAASRDAAITVTGPVASVLPYLEPPCVVTLPIAFGSGTRLKILEAFAAGRPVVSTAKGAEGLAAIDGVHLLIREEPAAMAEAVIELWTKPLVRARLCANALKLVRERYSWPVAAERIAQSLRVASPTASLPFNHVWHRRIH
jgi:glycosyltransferase involved in cell wall biosynthesis